VVGMDVWVVVYNEWGWIGKGVEFVEAVSGSPRATTTAGHWR